MPFAQTTRDRVMAALGLPVVIGYIQAVDDALNHADLHGGPTAVTRIEGLLTKYEAAEAALTAGSAQEGLIQADVLRWSERGKARGIEKELNRQRQAIAAALALEPYMSARPGRVRLSR